MAARRLCPPCGSERQRLGEVGRHFQDRANRRALGPPRDEAAPTCGDRRSEGRRPARATLDAKIARAVLRHRIVQPWSRLVRPCVVGSSRELRKPRIFAVRHHLLTSGVVRAFPSAASPILLLCTDLPGSLPYDNCPRSAPTKACQRRPRETVTAALIVREDQVTGPGLNRVRSL